jgi:hypothetical protein
MDHLHIYPIDIPATTVKKIFSIRRNRSGYLLFTLIHIITQLNGRPPLVFTLTEIGGGASKRQNGNSSLYSALRGVPVH